MAMYSVIDGFGERMMFGSKAMCERYIRESTYRPLYLVRRKMIQEICAEDDILPDEADKTAVINGEAPKTYAYVAKHERGGQIVFNNLEAVAKRFDISEQTLGEKLEIGAYKLRGRMKQWTIEKIENKGV